MTDGGARILVVDDSPATLEVVGRILSGNGHRVETASNVANAVRKLEGATPDLVITDFRMPGGDGLDLVRHVRENFPDTAVIMLTGFPSIEGAVEAVKGGAEAYLTKPFTRDELLETVERVLHAFKRRRVGDGGSPTALPLIGRSDAVRSLRAAVAVAADGTGPVTIEAPDGCDAVAVARAIHESGNRAKNLLIIHRCDLAFDGVGDLFGTDDHPGLVAAGNGGTLVLVEPEALDEVTQVHLLRLLQERRAIPAGGGRGRPADIRIIVVTARDLARQAGTGHFRRDLLERLSTHRIRITPLEHRSEDIIDLIDQIVVRESALLGCSVPSVSRRAIETLVASPWPGDLAELAATVRTAVAVAGGRSIEVTDLPLRFRFNAGDPDGETLTLQQVEADHIRTVLRRVGGNKTEAARRLGIDRKTLRAKLTRS